MQSPQKVHKPYYCHTHHPITFSCNIIQRSFLYSQRKTYSPSSQIKYILNFLIESTTLFPTGNKDIFLSVLQKLQKRKVHIARKSYIQENILMSTAVVESFHYLIKPLTTSLWTNYSIHHYRNNLLQARDGSIAENNFPIINFKAT